VLSPLYTSSVPFRLGGKRVCTEVSLLCLIFSHRRFFSRGQPLEGLKWKSKSFSSLPPPAPHLSHSTSSRICFDRADGLPLQAPKNPDSRFLASMSSAFLLIKAAPPFCDFRGCFIVSYRCFFQVRTAIRLIKNLISRIFLRPPFFSAGL